MPQVLIAHGWRSQSGLLVYFPACGWRVQGFEHGDPLLSSDNLIIKLNCCFHEVVTVSREVMVGHESDRIPHLLFPIKEVLIYNFEDEPVE
jgi:hypothetical protein